MRKGSGVASAGASQEHRVLPSGSRSVAGTRGGQQCLRRGIDPRAARAARRAHRPPDGAPIAVRARAVEAAQLRGSWGRSFRALTVLVDDGALTRVRHTSYGSHPPADAGAPSRRVNFPVNSSLAATVPGRCSTGSPSVLSCVIGSALLLLFVWALVQPDFVFARHTFRGATEAGSLRHLWKTQK